MFLDDISEKYKDKNVLIVVHGAISIPINCYFNGDIPQGSLIDVGFVLGNCKIAQYSTQKTKQSLD